MCGHSWIIVKEKAVNCLQCGTTLTSEVLKNKCLIHRSQSPNGHSSAVWGDGIEHSVPAIKFKLNEKSKPRQMKKNLAPAPDAPAENICQACGAISMFPVEKCDLCGQIAEKTVKKAEKRKKTKVSFEVFERTKIYKNRLGKKLQQIWFERPPPPEREELEKEIARLDQLLEDNLHHALFFDSEKHIAKRSRK